jgi:hypothetical protein
MTPQISHSSHQTATPRRAARRASFRTILLATSALASAALSTTVARATDATWTFGAGDGLFERSDNWNGGAIPDGTATFGLAGTHAVTMGTSHSLDAITVMPDAGAYLFTIDAGPNPISNALTLSGPGIVIQGGSTATFILDHSTLNFQGQASAGTATIFGSTAHINFSGTSTAGQAHFNNDEGTLDFSEQASAGSATIANSRRTFFEGQSKAGNATIFNSADLEFSDTSNAESASIQSIGQVFMFGQASGGKAQITLTEGGLLDISNLTTAGTTVGSLAGDDSSAVFLGGKNLAVGGNDLSTTFAGVIQDGGGGAATTVR